MATTPLIDISAIIVNWNTCTELEACLRSFAGAAGSLKVEQIVVDNASADGSAGMVTSKFPRVRLISNKSNIGFAAGVNQGIREARGRYLLILNPDILVRKGVLDLLAEALEADPRTGAVAPRLLNPDGSLQKGYFRKSPGIMQVLLFYTFLSKYAHRSRSLVSKYLEESPPPGELISEVEQIPGGCLLLKKSVTDTAGYMDESFLLFFEDVDWCYRMRKRGWKLQVVNTVSMVHLGGRSFKRLDTHWMFQRMILSLNRFVVKHGSLPLRVLTFCMTFGNSLVIFTARGLQRLFTRFPESSAAGRSYSCHRNLARSLPAIHFRFMTPAAGEDKLP